jgi:hypothetical protein
MSAIEASPAHESTWWMRLKSGIYVLGALATDDGARNAVAPIICVGASTPNGNSDLQGGLGWASLSGYSHASGFSCPGATLGSGIIIEAPYSSNAEPSKSSKNPIYPEDR